MTRAEDGARDKPAETSRNPLALYVAAGGNDHWDGRAAEGYGPVGPFATPIRARDEVRRLRAAGGLPHGAVVNIGKGRYFLRDSLALGAADSGTAAAPIVWHGHEARLVGGTALTGFEPYRGEIVQLDLKEAGLAGRPFGQLFFHGQRQPLARYPNLDPSDPHGGAWAHVARVDGEENRRSFYYGPEETHSWSHPEEARVPIFGGYDWAFSVLQIASHDPKTRAITLKSNTWTPLRVGDRYLVEGLFEELDAPGEWYRDPRTDTLYFWPPDGREEVEVVVPTLDSPITLDGAEHVVVRGFKIDICEGDGIRLKNCRHCLAAGNTVTNCGGSGIVVDGGEHSGARSNDVSLCGHHGISVAGGDRKTLTPGRNFADNNVVHHCARIWRTYRNGIAIRGVGNRIAHNLIHDMPHAGVTLGGNDNVMELNVVHHTNLESADTGGIYFCSRDWTQRGNVIRHNVFHHIGGFGKANSWAPVQRGKVKFGYPHFTWGIYLDDPTSGTHVFGNILYKVPMCGLHNHGGRDNVWENNIIVDCPALNAGQLAPDWSAWDRIYQLLRENRQAGSPYLDRYPEIADIADTRPEAMSGLVFRRNIVYLTKPGTAWLRNQKSRDWGGEGRQLLYQLRIDQRDFAPGAFDSNCIYVEEGLGLTVKFRRLPDPDQRLTWTEWQKTGADAHSILADPLFVNAAEHDYRLRPESPAIKLGFEPIPVEKIGPHRDEYRTEWPAPEARGAAELGDFTTERHYEVPGYRRLEARPYSLRRGLQCLHRTDRGEAPFKVAYFGGGIHPSDGWRKQVMTWLADKLGPAEAIDAGICDCVRGSGFSVYRFEHDVLTHQPELVFIDFASADHRTDVQQIKRSIEGVVRKALQAKSPPELVFLYAFRQGFEEDFAEGLSPHAVSAYERVAEHYGIPSVNLGYQVAQLHKEGKLLTKGSAEEAAEAGKTLFAKDGVRPTPEGNGIYATAICAALEAATKHAPQALVSTPPPLDAGNLENARQMPIARDMLSGEWSELPAGHELSQRFGRHFDTIWFTDVPGSKLTFRFRGTAASIFDIMGPDTGRARVTVDGKVVGIRQQVDPWAYFQRLASLPLAGKLDAREHSVEVELLPEAPDRSAPKESARSGGKYDPKLFEGVALRFGFIRILGEAPQAPAAGAE